MILYKPRPIKDYEVHRKFVFKYIRIIQDKDFLKVVQTKTDEYIKEVQKRYERRYNILNRVFRKLKQCLKWETE